MTPDLQARLQAAWKRAAIAASAPPTRPSQCRPTRLAQQTGSKSAGLDSHDLPAMRWIHRLPARSVAQYLQKRLDNVTSVLFLNTNIQFLRTWQCQWKLVSKTMHKM